MFPTPGDGADSDGLVFLSYSHADAAWAQRSRVLLKPVVRRKHLRLWDDTQIRVGDEWHPAIEEAVGRSRVALVLVSADFLASDYILDRELPALRANGVRLAAILVADCFWKSISELEAVQWLHDPDRDGPLGLHADNPAERDRRSPPGLRAAPDRDTGARAGRSGRRRGAPAAPPPAPDLRRPGVPAAPRPAAPNPPFPLLRGRRRAGGRHRRRPLPPLPALPPGYVVRDELDGLVDAVVGTAAGGIVGLTGAPAGVGLHGIGGIGKSVLAAAPWLPTTGSAAGSRAACTG